METLPKDMDLKAVETFNALRSSDDWQVSDDVHVSGLRDAILMLLVKNVSDIIQLNLTHHYRLGFRRFFIMDNNSTDETAVLIQMFKASHPEAQVCYITDFVEGYHQSVKMASLTKFAERYLCMSENPVDWIFPVDADEFITCCTKRTDDAVQSFNDILADQNAKLLLFSMTQAALFSVSRQETTSFSPTLAESEIEIWKTLDYCVFKTSFRTGLNVTSTMGNHFVNNYRGGLAGVRVMTEIGFCLLHFPLRSIEQIRLKIEDGIRGLNAARQPPGIGSHWREFHAQYVQDGDQALKDILTKHINLCL